MNNQTDTQDTLSDDAIDEIFEMYRDAPTVQFRYLVARNIIAADRTLRADTSPSLSDEDILDCFAAVKASGQGAYLVSVGRAIEAKCRTLRAGQSPTVPTAAERDVVAERKRQVSVEGWTPGHDDGHRTGAMARAAAAYALAGSSDGRIVGDELEPSIVTRVWPGWSRKWWKPKDRRSNLVKAGALILAEIERLDRAA